GRLAAMIASGVNPIQRPGDIIIVRSGVATGWATMAALAWAVWASRPLWRRALDNAGPAALIGLAGWHSGCLLRDACLGPKTDLPWAMRLDGSVVGRHPTELYAAALLAAIGGLLWFLVKNRPHLAGTGLPAGLALAAAGATRLITEPLRPALGDGPIGWYALAIVAGLVYAATLTIRPLTSEADAG
ncbi:MAG TPA: hypothetical protein ENH15_02330, partial [Actinobacteria bacterium]|nr:hypothetical protein [Actinomycetota bacterium]